MLQVVCSAAFEVSGLRPDEWLVEYTLCRPRPGATAWNNELLTQNLTNLHYSIMSAHHLYWTFCAILLRYVLPTAHPLVS